MGELSDSIFPARRDPNLALNNNMVLCVDDEPKGLQIRQLLLQYQGYRVLTATSGRESLALFTAHPISAVVLDYAMPGMDGGEVAAEMKRLKPEVKILLLSAYVDLPHEALRHVDARAVKGTSPVTLLNALQALLACKAAAAQSV